MQEDSEIRRLLGDVASRGVVESMPGLLVAARELARRDWDTASAPPDDPLEKRFGPVRLVVSRSWVPQPPDPRRIAWRVDDSGLLSFYAMAGAHHTPTLDAYVEQRGGVTQDGYYRFGATPIAHPTSLPGWELAEMAPQLPGRPLRFLRMLRVRRAILVLGLDATGGISASVGRSFAAVFQSIRLDPTPAR